MIFLIIPVQTPIYSQEINAKYNDFLFMSKIRKSYLKKFREIRKGCHWVVK